MVRTLFIVVAGATVAIAHVAVGAAAFGTIHTDSDRELAQRVLDWHLADCEVEKVNGGEGWVDAGCHDGRRFRLYAPLSCEDFSVLCDVVGIDAACWEIEAF